MQILVIGLFITLFLVYVATIVIISRRQRQMYQGWVDDGSFLESPEKYYQIFPHACKNCGCLTFISSRIYRQPQAYADWIGEDRYLGSYCVRCQTVPIEHKQDSAYMEKVVVKTSPYGIQIPLFDPPDWRSL